MLDSVAEELEMQAGPRVEVVRCARALGVRPEVVRQVLSADVLRPERTPLGWMRRLLDAERVFEREETLG